MGLAGEGQVLGDGCPPQQRRQSAPGSEMAYQAGSGTPTECQTQGQAQRVGQATGAQLEYSSDHVTPLDLTVSPASGTFSPSILGSHLSLQGGPEGQPPTVPFFQAEALHLLQAAPESHQ